MSSFSYLNKQAATLFVGSVVFQANETKTYADSQPKLDQAVPDKLTRFVDNVQDDNPLDDVTKPIPLSSNLTLSSTDDGKIYEATGSLTVNIPAGLLPRPQVIIIPPPSGIVTVVAGGGVTMNGFGTSIARARTNNVAGFGIYPYLAVDAYAVSGT